MGGLTTGGDTHRWCYTITDVQGPVFAPWNKFNTKCWDQTGTNFNPSTNKVSARRVRRPRQHDQDAVRLLHRRLRLRRRRQRGARLQPQPVADGRRARWAGRARPTSTSSASRSPRRARAASSTSSRTTTGVRRPAPTRRSCTAATRFTIMSTTGNVTGQGVPASFPSIYIGNNGDTQAKNDPPKGSYTTQARRQPAQGDQRDRHGDDDRRVQQERRRLQRHLRHLAGDRARRRPRTATRWTASSWSGSTSRAAGRPIGSMKATQDDRRQQLRRLGRAAQQRHQPEPARHLVRARTVAA